MVAWLKATLVVMCIGMSMLMMGCGCDKDEAAKCSMGSGCETYSKCIKDKNCCDFEESGGKVSDLLKGMCGADPSKNACK